MDKSVPICHMADINLIDPYKNCSSFFLLENSDKWGQGNILVKHNNSFETLKS